MYLYNEKKIEKSYTIKKILKRLKKDDEMCQEVQRRFCR